jgi:hypothetical protein
MTIAAQSDLTIRTVYDDLDSDFQPDCDFVDGHVEEREMGGIEHSDIQRELIVWFHLRRRDWKYRRESRAAGAYLSHPLPRSRCLRSLRRRAAREGPDHASADRH